MANDESTGERALESYPRPSVAVDTAVLTVTNALSVLLVRAGDDLRLPGTFLHEGETLSGAVLRSLRDKAGVTGLRPKQLRVFDAPGRDDRGWVLSVAHLDAVPATTLVIDTKIAVLVAVDGVPKLDFDHNQIVSDAVETLRTEYLETPDPRGLLKESFTLRDLQLLHEAVAGIALPRDTFRRAMEPQLVATGALAAGTVGKPPRLFTRKDGR